MTNLTLMSGDRIEVPTGYPFVGVDKTGMAYAYETRPTYYAGVKAWLPDVGDFLLLGMTSCTGGEDDIYEVNHG